MNNQDSTFKNMRQRYPRFDIIFSEGEVGHTMFIIMEGEVEIRKKTGKNTHKVLVTLKTGDFFGEMAIIENKPRTATAVAKTDSILITLDTDSFYNMVQKSSQFAVKMIKTLSSRLRRADHLIEYILGSNEEQQVVSGIASFVKSHSENDNKETQSRIELKEYLKWSRQNLGHKDDMVIQTIKRLIARKIVKIHEDPDQFYEFYMDKRLLARL